MNQLIELTQTTSTMSSREIAELTGKEHRNVLADIRKMLEELGGDSAEFLAQYTDSTGRTLPAFALPKRECLILVSGYSVILRAKIIDRWEALESGKVLPQSPAPALTHSYADAMTGLDIVCRSLNLEGSAKLGMFRKGTELTAPHLLPALPAYSIDAPRNEEGALLTGSGSSEVTVSITDLLESLGSAIKNQTANKRLIKLGLLADMTRPSTQGGQVRKFKAVTAKGLKYGKNITHPNNPKETQAHWFVSTGAELVRLIESV